MVASTTKYNRIVCFDIAAQTPNACADSPRVDYELLSIVYRSLIGLFLVNMYAPAMFIGDFVIGFTRYFLVRWDPKVNVFRL